MSGRESGDVDDPGLPARDQPERTEGGCKRFGQQAVAAGSTSTGSLGVIGRHPEIELTVEAGSEVTVHPGVPEDADATIEGDAVQLLEALSLRAPRLPIAEKAPVAARGPRRGLRRWYISGCSSLGAIVMRREPDASAGLLHAAGMAGAVEREVAQGSERGSGLTLTKMHSSRTTLAPRVTR